MSKKDDKYRLGKKRHQFELASREDMDEEDFKTYKDFLREHGGHHEHLRVSMTVGGYPVHRKMADELQMYLGFDTRSGLLQYLIETAYFQAKEQGFDYDKTVRSSKRNAERWKMRRKLSAARRETRQQQEACDSGIGES